MRTSDPYKRTHTSDSKFKKQAIKTVCMFHHRLLDETSLIMLIRNSYQEGFCSFKCYHSKAINHEILLAHICSFHKGCRTLLPGPAKVSLWQVWTTDEAQIRGLKGVCVYCVICKVQRKRHHFPITHTLISAAFKYVRNRIYLCKIKNKLEPAAVVLKLISHSGSFNKIKNIPVPWNFSSTHCLKVILPNHHEFY